MILSTRSGRSDRALSCRTWFSTRTMPLRTQRVPPSWRSTSLDSSVWATHPTVLTWRPWTSVCSRRWSRNYEAAFWQWRGAHGRNVEDCVYIRSRVLWWHIPEMDLTPQEVCCYGRWLYSEGLDDDVVCDVNWRSFVRQITVMCVDCLFIF